MSKIKVLPENIIQKIAAGEVVEKPASVLKELIENALDAEAAQIKVFLEQGGVEKIQVIDNGLGIDKDDLAHIFQRHSTSKIATEDDLMHIDSLGFRGEALYAIAAVSRVEVETKTKTAETGHLLQVKGGKKEPLKITGCPEGTAITVSDLFYNLPARKKFLKAEATELKYCREVFINEALACPELRFELYHNAKKIYQLVPQSFKERICALYEIEDTDLLKVTYDHQYLKISGFIGKPGISRTRKMQQHLFVNGRGVENKLVYSAVKQGFGSYLPAGSYPLFFLRFEIRPDLIDVNIHPRKEEVKFASTELIFNAVRQAVAKTLVRHDLTPAAGITGISFPETNSNTTSQLKRFELSRPFITEEASKQTFEFNQSPVSPGETVFPIQAQEKSFPWEEEMSGNSYFQVDLTYLVEIKNKEIVIYDQHALHERVLFEQLVEHYLENQQNGETQALLFPQEIRLLQEELEIVKKEEKVLRKIGFKIEVSNNSVSIIEIPAVLNNDNLEGRFKDFVDGLLSKEELTVEGNWKLDHQTLRTLTFLACRMAIKAGDYLSATEMKELIHQFGQTRERYTCPHGRPVAARIGRRELDKLFMRDKKEI